MGVLLAVAVSILCDNGPTPVVGALESAAKAGEVARATALHKDLERQIGRLRNDLARLVATAPTGDAA